MTWNDYTAKWRKLKADLKRDSGREILEAPASEMMQAIKTRVFEQGTTTDGEQMQEYSSRPFTFLRKDFINKSAFSGQGDSMFLPGGYKQLREIQGLQTSFIDLKYSGRFRADYKMRTSANKVFFMLASNRATRLRFTHEIRFGQFLEANQMEIDAYSKIVVDFVGLKVTDTLTG